MHYWQNFTTLQKLLLCFDSTRNTCYFKYNWILEYKVMATKCLGLFRVWLMARWCLCLSQYKCLFISIIEFTYKSLCVQIHTLQMKFWAIWTSLIDFSSIERFSFLGVNLYVSWTKHYETFILEFWIKNFF